MRYEISHALFLLRSLFHVKTRYHNIAQLYQIIRDDNDTDTRISKDDTTNIKKYCNVLLCIIAFVILSEITFFFIISVYDTIICGYWPVVS